MLLGINTHTIEEKFGLLKTIDILPRQALMRLI